MPKTQCNTDERDRLIFGRALDWKKEGLGGVEHFTGMTHETAQKLLEIGALNREDAQNCSPEAGVFVDFMKTHPKVTAHGYVVSPLREDCRVTLEGLEYNGPVTVKLACEFAQFNGADDYQLTPDGFFCWWD